MGSCSWEPGMWVLSNSNSLNHYTNWTGYITGPKLPPQPQNPSSCLKDALLSSIQHPPPTSTHSYAAPPWQSKNPTAQVPRITTILPHTFLLHFHWPQVLDLARKWPKFQDVLALPMDTLVILFKWVILKSQSWNTIKNFPTQPHDISLAYPWLLCLRESSHIFQTPLFLLSDCFSRLNSCVKLGQDLRFIQVCIILEFLTIPYNPSDYKDCNKRGQRVLTASI